MTRFLSLTGPLLLAGLLAFLPSGQARAGQDPAALKALGDHLMGSVSDTMKDHGWMPQGQSAPVIAGNGAYDTITLPGLAFRGDGGRILNMGRIVANVTPGTRTGDWKVTMALPAVITMNDSAGNTLMTFKPGTQNFSGLYSTERGAFTQFNARYKNASLDYKPYAVTAAFPDIAATGQFSDNGGGAWTGAANINAVRPHIGFASGGSLDFDRLTAGINADHYSAERMARIESAVRPGPGESLSLILTILQGTPAGAARTSGINITAQQGKIVTASGPANPPQIISFNNANLSLRSEGGDAGNMNLHTTGGATGLRLAPATPNVAAAVPARLSLDIDTRNIPVDALVKAGASGQGAVKKVLSDAHVTTQIKDTSIGNDAYNLDIDGMLTENDRASLGRTGYVNMQFFGMDTLAGALGAVVTDPKTSPALLPLFTKAQGVLLVTSLVGLPGKDRQGRAAKTYRIDLMDDGRTMLNGQDMQPILQMLPPVK